MARTIVGTCHALQHGHKKALLEEAVRINGNPNGMRRGHLKQLCGFAKRRLRIEVSQLVLKNFFDSLVHVPEDEVGTFRRGIRRGDLICAS